MTAQVPPRIEFPCEDYTIKVIGDSHDTLKALVLEIVRKHAPDLDTSKVTDLYSSNGKYQSLRMPITATSIQQLEAINQDLKATGRVHMVL